MPYKVHENRCTVNFKGDKLRFGVEVGNLGGPCHCERSEAISWSYRPLAQIFPSWIHSLDQCDFLFSRPSFNLFLLLDGVINPVGRFVINQLGNPILGCASSMWNRSASSTFPTFVLLNTSLKIVSHSRVESRVPLIRHDVDVVNSLSHGSHEIASSLRSSQWQTSMFYSESQATKTWEWRLVIQKWLYETQRILISPSTSLNSLSPVINSAFLIFAKAAAKQSA